MGDSETDSRQSALAESRKRRRQEGESGDARPGDEAAKTRHSKRRRTISSASGSSDSGDDAMGRSEGGSSDYGSEEGEVDEGRGASAGNKTEEGEIHSSGEESSKGEHVSTATSSSPPSSPGPHSAGWNRGISAGQVQTSLSSMTRKVSSTPAPDPATTQPQPQPRKERPPSSPKSPSSPPSHFQKSGISLKLPPPGDRNAGQSWQVRFQEWTTTLLELNPEQVAAVTPEFVLGAYDHFIDRVCTMHNKKKRAAKAGAELFTEKGSLSEIVSSAGGIASGPSTSREDVNGRMGPANGAAENRAAQAQESSLPGTPTAVDWEFALEGKPGPQTSAQKENNANSLNGVSPGGPTQAQPKQNGSSMIPPPQPPASVPSGDEELNLQRKYFPRFNADQAREMCILCLQHGHSASTCPTHDCKYCGARYQHGSFACPSKRRCAKCKGPGHVVKDCNKPEITRDQEDALTCVHCGRDDHYEKDCDVLWRTYCPPEFPEKCHTILAFCANCGEDGHFFFNCAEGRLKFPKPRTWCEENLTRYLDKASKRAPISEVKPTPSLRRPELAGRSNDNIYFESDDSEGEISFLGNRVQPKKSVGRINVSSNIHFGGQAGGSHGESRLPPSATLPPRPQSYADTTRSEARQQDGGRRQHQLPPRPPVTRRGGGNYQAVPPPPGLQRNPSDGGGSRGGSNGNSRGGKKNSRGGRGGRGNGRGGNSRSNRGGGKWQ